MSIPELPFPSHFTDVNGQRMHFLDEGEGNPIVMVHGNPTWCFYYRNLMAGLRDLGRCIAPDHIGCGLSSKPHDSVYAYTLKSRVDDLENLLDQIGVSGKVTLVLHDWGGMIGLAWAMRHPEMVARLVLFNTSAFHMPKDKDLPWQISVVRNNPLGPFLVRGLNAFAVGAAKTCCTRNPMTRELRSAYCAPYDSWENRIATLRFVQDIPLRPGDPAYDIVSEVEQGVCRFAGLPTFIGWGMRDFVFDSDYLARFTAALPQAEVHRFNDCGHYILEDAKDEIVPLVRSFLHRRPV